MSTHSNPHFYSSSGGNAGLACVTAATTLGRPSTVVVPSSTSEMMKARLRGAGASEVITHGDHWSQADQHVRRLVQENNGVYCPPFDHELVWQGNATLVAELGRKPDAIVCSVGGGGLFIGILLGLAKRGWSDVPVVAVETHGAASLHDSIKARRLVTLGKIDTIATSLGATTVAEKALSLSLERPVTPLLVSDAQAAIASYKFADDHKIMVEAACGAALAPAYFGMLPDVLPGWSKTSHVVIVVCGGSNISVEKMAEYKSTYADQVQDVYKGTVPSTVS